MQGADSSWLSPQLSVVVAVVWLTALFALSSDPTPGALGLVAISSGLIAIEAKVIGATGSRDESIDQVYEVTWGRAVRSVPARKKRVVLVAGVDQCACSGEPRESWRG